jgi:hypothetical protein
MKKQSRTRGEVEPEGRAGKEADTRKQGNNLYKKMM